MTDAGVIHVASGQVRLGRPGEVLDALLGSCVAIALISPGRERAALAHCLLPDAGGRLLPIGARYVDQAVVSLLALLKADPAERAALEVVLVGGAAMLGAAGMGGAVGAANVNAARVCLAAHGLAITHEDTGGRRGRLLSIDCASGRLALRKIERFEIDQPRQENHHAHA